ncbi:ABC transporter permease [Parasulfitobacter algicola]|uniref:ABC transporter permease n=1 Tax=Parasulfitobacter algicola TaxID=2614809 RepID=A0ABX2IRQ0_9RHOB|nr:ABC transporter permease [Sulfitobacter algicola]NSX55200.1 ABC transporter permease [Sulfitobacter algicola]
MNGLRIYALIYLVFLYAPIILLPIFAFNDGTVIAFPLQGVTTKWFSELMTVNALHDSVKNSLYVAVITAIFSTLLGICAARAQARYRFPAKKGIVGLIMLPLVLPEIIVAVSLLIVFLSLGFNIGLWTIILGHVLICTPFSIAILNSSFQNLDPSIEEAAQDLGETRFGTFLKITLPLVMPGIVSSLLIAFTISMDEFIIAFFLSGTEPTLPVYLWSQLRFPQRLPVVMALGTILVVLSILILILAEAMRRYGLRRSGMQDKGGFL